MVYITGDTHGNFSRFYKFSKKAKPTKADVMIILGDAGLNYYGNRLDALRKSEAAVLPMTFFCIHGNHEMRPEHIASYKTKRFRGGTVWYEPDFPNLLFARDGDVYRLGGQDCIVIGGAYSVDKFYRLQNGWQWFEDEQPSERIKARVENVLTKRDYKIDVVLSHTCPIQYEPIEVFLPSMPSTSPPLTRALSSGLGPSNKGLITKRGTADTITQPRKSTSYGSCSRTSTCSGRKQIVVQEEAIL